MLSLKRVTDPEFLLCHKCGKSLNGAAHKHCAEAALKESKGKRLSKLKHVQSITNFEGVGKIGSRPCHLENGSIIIIAEEVRKIREEGFTSVQTGTKYGPWANGRLRERVRVQNKEAIEEVIKEIEEEDWSLYKEDKDDLFSLAYGYSQKIFLAKMVTPNLEEPFELIEPDFPDNPSLP